MGSKNTFRTAKHSEAQREQENGATRDIRRPRTKMPEPSPNLGQHSTTSGVIIWAAGSRSALVPATGWVIGKREHEEFAAAAAFTDTSAWSVVGGVQLHVSAGRNYIHPIACTPSVRHLPERTKLGARARRAWTQSPGGILEQGWKYGSTTESPSASLEGAGLDNGAMTSASACCRLSPRTLRQPKHDGSPNRTSSKGPGRTDTRRGIALICE
ncbi:hypothetical protein K438DRAFT_1767572 [Mycena galopus ATCC 62051]|nr:hypothetical protein K438DRAFT_1767572 [Mycena galopus ATCC 62051]